MDEDSEVAEDPIVAEDPVVAEDPTPSSPTTPIRRTKAEDQTLPLVETPNVFRRLAIHQSLTSAIESFAESVS